MSTSLITGTCCSSKAKCFRSTVFQRFHCLALSAFAESTICSEIVKQCFLSQRLSTNVEIE